jgi:predicted component of type VI protein secretion system
MSNRPARPSLSEAASRPMRLRLVVLTPGKQQGKAIEIKGPEFLVGRDPKCQLRPGSPLISNRHCAIVPGNGQAFVRDFGSTNGTFLNDQPVQGEAELHHDDRLKIGPLLFRVCVEDAVPAPAAKPVVAAKAPARVAAPGPEIAAEEDEDIAAMLLSLPSGDGAADPPSPAAAVPEGSTVRDIVVQSITRNEAPMPAGNPAAKPASGDSSRAAADLLKKYMTRPRAAG